MRTPRILFWYRKDLRISDNRALIKSYSLSKALTSIYIFDENYNLDFNAPSRAWFLSNSLKELKSKWEQAGSRLIIESGDPKFLIPKIAKLIKANYVAWNKTIEPYEIDRDLQVEKELERSDIKLINMWDHLLIEPSMISTGTSNPYTVYGPFYKNFKKQILEKNFINQNLVNFKLSNLEDLPSEIVEHLSLEKSHQTLNEFQKNIDFSGNTICPCKPGENAAEELLDNFLSSKKLINYASQRDFPSINGTSYLSASLRFGTISIRKVWNKTIQIHDAKMSEKSLISIETWQKELAWREFYQHCLYHFPELEKGPYRKKWKNFSWQNNHEWFTRWSQGDTGIPIIDASMRQLNQSGWMHNRCRMIVASFLVKDLICNWEMGEKKFMEHLVDGDLAANNGGWQWSASSGMDPKPLRIFNPHTQTKKFDPLCDYIKYWIPELSNVKNTDIITCAISKFERKNYPDPIINHNLQQRIFKSLYAEI
tara:strand:- start:85 stop:1530 length:1446 start_codon:yes stop_codon:yes gene_type:complete